MMDRGTQRTALRLLRELKIRMQTTDWRDEAARRSVCVSIEQVNAVCKRDFTPARYRRYEEIYRGLKETLKALEGTQMRSSEQSEYGALCGSILQYAINMLRTETEIKKEIVFLPYKASMWDSMESVWKAACADKERVNAYVMPIPYADRAPDGSAAAWRCEAADFPAYVPVLDWQKIDFAEWHPDVIFIHNPYDNQNFVTSVSAQYYSSALRSCTDLLIYVPYYVTTGGMGDGQRLCAAYVHADYIVIQSESLRPFFDDSIPEEKLVALGSPKLDRVLSLCAEPPEPPAAWKKKCGGKKVYFYNTSLGEMLSDVEGFFEKLRYVFSLFKRRKDACLLWRPHPLMEATFRSIRGEQYAAFLALKKQFIDEDIGIYDDTPDIERSIAFSDVYIGESGTSVTALFGVTGKAMFILNNRIHTLPTRDDARGELFGSFTDDGQDDWFISGNRLYHAAGHDYRYTRWASLPGYTNGESYARAIEVGGRVYICPRVAQEILRLKNGRIEKRIPLPEKALSGAAFFHALRSGPYIFLLPCQYPAIVRLDTRDNTPAFVENVTDRFVRRIDGEWRVGGCCIWRGFLLLAAPDGAEVLAVDCVSLAVERRTIRAAGYRGAMTLAADGDDIWALPFEGGIVARWNPLTDEARAYDAFPQGFSCRHIPLGFPCTLRPFGVPAFDEWYVYLPPFWGDCFVRLEKETGVAATWATGLRPSAEGKNAYFFAYGVGWFVRRTGADTYSFFYLPERRLYEMRLSDGACRPLAEARFDEKSVASHAAGFSELSVFLPYGCFENAFNSLLDLLDGTIHGAPHDSEKQKKAYGRTADYHDGTSGRAVYDFAMRALAEREGRR